MLRRPSCSVVPSTTRSISASGSGGATSLVHGSSSPAPNSLIKFLLHRPPTPRPKPYPIFHLAGLCNTFVEQMHPLAPQRFEQPVGDETGHFLAHPQRPHAQAGVDLHRRVERLG